MKKLLALLLTFVLIVSVFPLSVFAMADDADVESVVIAPLHLTEYVDGRTNYWNDYIEYQYFPNDVTVNMDDGTVIQGDYWDIAHTLPWIVEVHSDPEQSEENPWTVGTYEAVLTIRGVDYPFTVVIDPFPVASIEIEDMTFEEYTGGNFTYDGYYDGENYHECDHAWYYYDAEPKEFTVKFTDGTEGIYSRDDLYNEFGSYGEAHIEQTFEDPLTPGEHTGTFKLYGVTTEYTVNITPSRYAGIRVNDMYTDEFGRGWYENDGYWDDERDEYVEVEWFHYDAEPGYLTLIYSDGTEEQLELEEVYDLFGRYPEIEDGQSYDNQWGVGHHEVTCRLGALSCTYDFEVKQRPVMIIGAEDLTIMENTNGDMDHGSWYDDEGDYHEADYFFYYGSPEYVTVRYAEDGREETIPFSEYGDGQSYSVISDQSAQYPWGLGEHDAILKIHGVEIPYKVTIVTSPYESIIFDKVSYYEGSHCSNNYTEVMVDGEIQGFAWSRYNVEPTGATINFTDSTSVHMTWDELCEYFNDIWYVDEQAYDNDWEVGEHEVRYFCDGVPATQPVEILETPIDHYEIADMEIIEGTDQYTSSWYNEDTGEYREWLAYSTVPDEITVYFKDGAVETYNTYEFNEMYGYGMAVSNDQSHDNIWEVGHHEAYLHFLKVDASFGVDIVPDPIESIYAEPRTIIEGMDCTMDWDWDPETDQPTPEYLRYYDTQPSSVTINYTDGTSLTCDIGELESLTGYEGYWRTDQSYNNQWGVGHHAATFEYMGHECEYDVEIIPSPVASITAEPLILIEGADCYESADRNPETGEWDLKYMRYHTYPNNVTVTMTDGTVFNDTSFEYDGNWYYVHVDDDQSYDNQWGVGHHTVTLSCCGKTAEVDVEIVENPIDRVEFHDLTLREHLDGYFSHDYEGNEVFFYVFYPEFTAYMKDGRVIESNRGNIEINGEYYSVRYYDYQSYDNQWDVGEHIVTMSVVGVRGDAKVTIIPNDVESITISGTDDLILTLHHTDGTSEDCEAWGFEFWGETRDTISGVLNTDRGNFFTKLRSAVSENGVSTRDRGVSLDIGDMTSNTLEVNRWARFQDMRSMYPLFANAMRATMGFDGFEEDDYDVDEVVWFAVNSAVFCDDRFPLAQDEGGWYMILPAETVKEAVKYIFGIDNIDLKEYSLYDPQNPDSVKVYDLAIGGFWGETDFDRNGDGWLMTFRPEDDIGYDFLEIGLRGDLTIEHISFEDEVPIDSVTISGDDTLEITAIFEDGTELSATATGFDTPNPAAYPLDGVLHTTEGDVDVEIYFDRTDDGCHRFVDRNVRIKIGTVESNSLESNAWLKSRLMGNSIPFVAAIFKLARPDWNGIDISTADANTLVEFAAYATGEFGFYEPEFANGKAYIKVPKAVALDIVSYVFGIDDLDLSAYRQIGTQGTGEYLDVELFDFDFAALPDGTTEITYNNGSWTVDYMVTGGNVKYDSIKTEAAPHFNIKKITFGTKGLKGDVNCDGKVTMKDVLMLRKYLANIETITEQGLENAEVTGDGKVTMKDVLKLRKYLAGIETLG